jgi:hypothetical protein
MGSAPSRWTKQRWQRQLPWLHGTKPKCKAWDYCLGAARPFCATF